MAKAPRPGRVKTRLVPPLSAESAARLAAAFVADLTHRLGDVDGARLVVALPPGESVETLAEYVPEGTPFVDQGPGDLGARLEHVLGAALAEGDGPALAIGADHPNLPRAHVVTAVEAARRGEPAWVTTHDGGFACIACPRPLPGLFADVPWSTPRVAEAVRNNARRLGVSLRTTDRWYDVDTVDDLRRLRDDPDSRRRCPRTMGLLDRLAEVLGSVDGEEKGPTS